MHFYIQSFFFIIIVIPIKDLWCLVLELCEIFNQSLANYNSSSVTNKDEMYVSSGCPFTEGLRCYMQSFIKKT
jgi:hypothetical protein